MGDPRPTEGVRGAGGTIGARREVPHAALDPEGPLGEVRSEGHLLRRLP